MNEQTTKKHRSRLSFTLIELLIVIAIIAILAGMLLPALNAARQRAYAIECIGNMKSFGNVYHQYKMDNKEYPPSADVLYYQGNTKKKYNWQMQVMPYLLPQINTSIYVSNDQLNAWLNDRISKKFVYRCPNLAANKYRLAPATYMMTGQAFTKNQHNCAGSWYPIRGTTLIFMDGDKQNPNYWRKTNERGRTNLQHGSGIHSKQNNITCYDGHVEPVPVVIYTNDDSEVVYGMPFTIEKYEKYWK